jgi:hypothetical protein
MLEVSMRTSHVLHILGIVSAVAAGAANAQTVRGTMADSATGRPIEHAFIVLLGDSGEELGRVLTDVDGRFALAAPGPGTFQLRSERIGVKAHVSDAFDLTQGEVKQIDMRVVPVVIRLDMIVVEGDAKKCRIVEEQGLETATVWEEARKALVNVAWNEANETARFEIRSFERSLDGDRRLVDERSRTVTRESVAPFRNPPASELQEYGYVLEDNSITRERGRAYDDTSVYYAPDAQVFFSDPFLDNHCFKLKRDKDYEGLVGLEFEPVKGSKVTEVEGVLWLKEESSELGWLELTYTNLRSNTRERYAAARVEFHQLPNGLWFVSEWWIRMPFVETQVPEIGGLTRKEEILWGFKEDGGEVLRVLTPAGEVLYEVTPEG